MKKIFERLGLLFVGCFLGFIIVECYLRFSDPIPRPSAPIAVIHKTRGLTLKPNVKAKIGKSNVWINSKGLRDYEYQYRKDKDVFRLIAIGDSFAFGWGLDLQNIYCKWLEKKLNENFNQLHYEVINFGVPNYNTYQELVYLKEEGLKYSPDLLIVGYYLNDAEIIDLTTYQQTKKDPMPRQIEYERDALLKKSYFYRFSKRRIGNIAIKLKKVTPNYIKNFNGPGWEISKKSLIEISSLAKQNNFKVILVIFPILVDLREYAFIEIHNLITATSKELGFYVIDMLDHFKYYKAGDLRVSIEDGHINNLGHKITADAIYDLLIKENLIKLNGDRN